MDGPHQEVCVFLTVRRLNTLKRSLYGMEDGLFWEYYRPLD